MKRITSLIALFLLFLGIACRSQTVTSRAYDMMLSTLLSHSVNEVSVNEIDSTKNLVFLDAREKAEYDVSHIPGAIWIGYEDFDTSRLQGLDKNDQIIVYCSVGYRSEKITEKIEKQGFKNTSNLYGGIFEWVNQKRPVENLNDTVTQKVHAYDHIWGIWLTNGEKVYE